MATFCATPGFLATSRNGAIACCARLHFVKAICNSTSLWHFQGYVKGNMSSLNPTELLQALEWRYATKVFDPAKKIPAETWQALERALVLTPTSYGLQPYQFLVIGDPVKRTALVPHSWGQKQVVDASHFVVFTAKTKMTEADVDKLISRISSVRGVPAESMTPFWNMMIGDVVKGPRGKIAHEWAARQAYIALGNLMTCAAVLGVDACPMEGLVPAEYDKVLNLDGSGYATIVACALGYRSPDDKYAKLAKVRYDANEVVRHL
jgi:nitroreductase